MTGRGKRQPEWRVLLTERAETDIKAIVRFILNRKGPDMAQDILNRLIAAKDSLSSMPGRGRIPPELERIPIHGVRECLIGPYRMFYRMRETEKNVEVIIVVDGRRDLSEILKTRLLKIEQDIL